MELIKVERPSKLECCPEKHLDSLLGIVETAEDTSVWNSQAAASGIAEGGKNTDFETFLFLFCFSTVNALSRVV